MKKISLNISKIGLKMAWEGVVGTQFMNFLKNLRKTFLKFPSHPVWLVGFRPFFILGILSGAFLPLLWYLVLMGYIKTSPLISPLQWHVHEMFYGFGWAVLGGFLLTSTKNWVQIRGYHGSVLIVLSLFWLIERLVFFLPPEISLKMPGLLRLVFSNAFLFSLVPLLLWTLVKYRKTDTYSDNWLFVLCLPLFLVSKILILRASSFDIGWMMTIGLFRLALLIMLERTLTQFVKVIFQVHLYRNKWLDGTIKMAALISVFGLALPPAISSILSIFIGALLLIRFFLWSPLLGFQRLDIASMYYGYLGLTLHFFLEFFRLRGQLNMVGDISTHSFTLWGMGVIIPAMLVRISMGHTGRKIIFTIWDKTAIKFAVMGGLVRIVLPQIWPRAYSTWVLIAALFWTICYSILALHLIPFLLKPRVDGKE